MTPTVDQASTMLDVLADIENDPGSWSQRFYRMAGGSCFAGKTALRVGGKWKRPAERNDPFMIHPVTGHEVHCRTLAREYLGLDQLDAVMLFRSTNTLNDLRRLVEKHIDAALENA